MSQLSRFKNSLFYLQYKKGKWSRRMSSEHHKDDLYYFADHVDRSEDHFGKILIANRGEIACRIIRTAKRLGIKTVAIFSSADFHAPHVRQADEAICVGEPSSKNSYLNMGSILEAVRVSGAQAVHPGYGFLSESAEFAAKLESMGVEFIGPTSEVLRVMGDKLAAKRLASSVGVAVLPGSERDILDAEDCAQEARLLGYPVMIKTLAGGGGKGMRIARNDCEAKEGFALSILEGAASCGDKRVFIEKYIEAPRHIEFQVLGDKCGNVIHLHERECSIQRRNQKVIEEAPSALLSGEQRASMGQQAVSLCKAVKYHSAGTVEFLVESRTGQYFFLEVNPRLQVEHPVTEAISGIDLVHQTLRIAKGHPLKLKQNEIPMRGWAIECRVYAENPFKDFGLPCVGRLHAYNEPTAISEVTSSYSYFHKWQVRCDSGVEEGSSISIDYDPLISKLVCHSDTRQGAIEASINALDNYVIRGVTNNISFLRDVLSKPDFKSGNLSTAFLQREYPCGFKGRKFTKESKDLILAAACSLHAAQELRHRNIPSENTPRSLHPRPSRWDLRIKLQNSEKVHEAEITYGNYNIFTVKLDDNKEVFRVENDINFAQPLLPLSINGSKIIFQCVHIDATGFYKLIYEGSTFAMKVQSRLAHELSKYLPHKQKKCSAKVVVSPMPGLVKQVTCKQGDLVSEGQELCVIEAMKMHNSLSAVRNATVAEVKVKPGDTVSKNDHLIILK